MGSDIHNTFEEQESFIENHGKNIEKLEEFLEVNLRGFWDFIQSDENHKSAFSDIIHDFTLKYSVSELIEKSEVKS